MLETFMHFFAVILHFYTKRKLGEPDGRHRKSLCGLFETWLKLLRCEYS